MVDNHVNSDLLQICWRRAVSYKLYVDDCDQSIFENIAKQTSRKQLPHDVVMPLD